MRRRRRERMRLERGIGGLVSMGLLGMGVEVGVGGVLPDGREALRQARMGMEGRCPGRGERELQGRRGVRRNIELFWLFGRMELVCFMSISWWRRCIRGNQHERTIDRATEHEAWANTSSDCAKIESGLQDHPDTFSSEAILPKRSRARFQSHRSGSTEIRLSACR